MLEMSAAKSPALALTSAVTPTMPAPTSTDGAQIVDFSVVLAGATLADESPELMGDTLVQPEANAAPPPELLPHPATQRGKSDTSGNPTGKNLPAGKLPAVRPTIVTEKAARKLRNETAELQDASTDAASEPDAVLPAKSIDKASGQTAGAASASNAPSPANISPAPEAASNLAAAAPGLDAIVPQATANETAAKPQPTLTKLQSRTQPQVVTSEARAPNRPVAAKLEGTPVEASAAPNPGPAMRTQPAPLSGSTRTIASPPDDAVSASVPNAIAIREGTTPGGEGAAVQSTPLVATPAPQTTVITAPTRPTIAPAATAPETGTPATITHLQPTAAVISAPIIAAPKEANAIAKAQQSPLRQSAEPVVMPQRAPRLTGTTTTTLRAQTAPSALMQAAAPSLLGTLAIVEPTAAAPAASFEGTVPVLVADLPNVEAIAAIAATSIQAAAPASLVATPAGEQTIEVAATPSENANTAATLPTAKVAPVNAPATSLLAAVAPTTVTQATVGAAVVEPASGRAAEASPVQLAKPAAPVLASLTPTPTIAAATDAATIVSPAPVAQDRSPAIPAAAQPTRIEAAMVAPELAVSDKDHKAAATIALMTATEVPANFARPQMDASTLAAEFRSAPSAPTMMTTSTAATPTQDIAALVDRIAEARAAASPHTIRASLVHEEFGAVSVNLRSEASHIHVTLGSADPGFAPAVQAAAAASLAGNGSDDANARRETSMPQQFTPTQDTSTRADTSSQQQATRDRAPAPDRDGGREAPARQEPAATARDTSTSASRRWSGVYA